MSLLGGVATRVLGLPAPATGHVTLNRAVTVMTDDGIALRGDHYAPDIPGAPTVLIRTPYGRRGGVAIAARTVAEQGFHVLVQCCRGTFDSGGTFMPMRHERDDGMATIRWLREQPWYTGELCTFGPSYVGFTQWAIAADAKPDLKAMSTFVTASQFRDPTYAGGAFSLDTVLTWAELMSAQKVSRWDRQLELWRGQPSLRQALGHLPLSEADAVATGAEVEFVREWLTHTEPEDGYWSTLGHGHRIADIDADILMIGGWYDIFLPWQLNDYAALRAAGKHPKLIIGSWHHGSIPLYLFALRESVRWFREHTNGPSTGAVAPAPSLNGHGQTGHGHGQTGHGHDHAGHGHDQAGHGPAGGGLLGVAGLATGALSRATGLLQQIVGLGNTHLEEPSTTPGGGTDPGAVDEAQPPESAAPVRVHVGGQNRWRELPDWPPPGWEPTPWHLYPAGGLGADPATATAAGAREPDRFTYDPADPTPHVGGPLLMGKTAGRRDNATLEARDDVLVYTSAPLAEPLQLIGPVQAVIHQRSSLPYFDVFVRLCDVDLSGRSYNVCDGLVRVVPGECEPDADGVQAVRVELWPTAYRFVAGHRLRVQVSGGAHPRYARNPGTGEPLGTATRLVAGDREVFHDPEHPSAIVLPVSS